MLASLRRVLPVIAVAGWGALVTPLAPDPPYARDAHEAAAACSSLVTRPRTERPASAPITVTHCPLWLTAGADRPRARVATRSGTGR